MAFVDRIEAGRRLADVVGERLGALDRTHAVVVGLPRGGVPVAEQVANALDVPLDVILVRKLGVPVQPELAAGAIGEDGVRVENDDVMMMARLTSRDLDRVEARERAELERRVARFRAVRARVPLDGCTAIVVDDGIATGATARAACAVARAHGAARVVLAVPVAPHGWEDGFRDVADELIAVETPTFFSAVGQWYRNFAPVSNDEVVACLERADRADPPRRREVHIPVRDATLDGTLTLPPGSTAVVVFAHGSGSSRHSPRNQYVAEVLQQAGLGTLLFDLLSQREETSRANVFDIELLRHRLVDATAWLRNELGDVDVGYFGASTGAAAALSASTHPEVRVGAVVSRGGRPDLAGAYLPTVTAPTLLIVGSRDQAVLGLNEDAKAQMRCTVELAVVPGATHLFEEPGTLQQAAALACDWFTRHLQEPA